MTDFNFQPVAPEEPPVHWVCPEGDGEEHNGSLEFVTYMATQHFQTVHADLPPLETSSADTVIEAHANLTRAVQVNAAPEELAALQDAVLDAEGVEEGDPWRQPIGAQDAYPLGAIVTHNGGTWESTVAANVWEPGVSGWKDAGPGIPNWVQPSGAHDAYALGDIVRHNDKVWQSDVADNVWEPGVFGWTEIEEP